MLTVMLRTNIKHSTNAWKNLLQNTWNAPAGLAKFTAAFQLTVKQQKLQFTAKNVVHEKKYKA